MTSSLYPKGADHLLGKTAEVDLATDMCRWLAYAGPFDSTHEFVSDLDGASIAGRSDPFSVSISGGVVSQDDDVFVTGDSGGEFSLLILAKDTGTDATSALIACCESYGVGAVDAGSSFPVFRNPIGIFALEPVTIVFDSSSVWECPAGVTQVYVECVGGGGGGPSSIGNSGGGGGGGGAYAARRAVPVSYRTAYTVAVGAGGSLDTDGGTSAFTGDGGVQVAAVGGKKGIVPATVGGGGQGGQGSASTGDTGLVFSGGNGGGGQRGPGVGGGGGGASGNKLGIGANGSNRSGNLGGGGGAGANGGGSGGHGGDYDTPDAHAGQAPGGGGGGGGGFNNGNRGASGRVTLTIGT